MVLRRRCGITLAGPGTVLRLPVAGLPPARIQRPGDTEWRHEPPWLGAAEDAVRVCDGGESRALGQAGASGTRRLGLLGGFSNAAPRPGSPAGFTGEDWVKYTLSSSFVDLLRCEECGRESLFYFPLPDQVIQTCSGRFENLHRN